MFVNILLCICGIAIIWLYSLKFRSSIKEVCFMKKVRIVFSVLLVAALLLAMSGCYVVRGQKMSKLKGTYKLTHYTYTPQYEIKGSYRPTSRDYINDERYLYEDYLVITGEGRGYYIHKDANTPAYVKEVTLSYEYNTEDSSKVDYVIFKDVLTTSEEAGINRVAVNGNLLNYSKSSVDLFGIRTESLSVRWEKVDSATDLSYVKEQLGSMKEYDYNAFGVRGVYELTSSTDVETGEYLESQYQYLYIVVDTAKGMRTAKVYYALKETPSQHVVKQYAFSGSEDWSTFTVGATQWTVDPTWGNYYYYENGGVKSQITCVGSDISDARIQELIDLRTPVTEE